MMRKLGSVTLVLLLAASTIPLLAGGAEIHISNIGEGDVLSTKLFNISGTATPTPDNWTQGSTEEFDEGNYFNVTLNADEDLISYPNVGLLTKDASNPVVDLGDNNTYNQMGTMFGTVILDGDTLKMWSMGKNKTSVWNPGYGTSDNGTGFDNQNATLDYGGVDSFDEVEIELDWVMKEGGTYKMWYTGMDNLGIYRIGYATSQNGIDWTKQNGGDPVLDIGPVNMFDGGGVATPCVIKDGNTYKMWYAGMISYSGDLWQIGYATSQNGIDWTKQNEGEPVLSFGKSSTFDEDGAFRPSVIKDGDIYRLWYIGIPDLTVGYANSVDGINWERMNNGEPILTRGGAGSFDENGIRTITVLRDDNDYLMYYTGTSSSNEYRVGLAKAPLDGLSGMYTSNYKNAGMRAYWGEVSYVEDVPVGSSIEFETRVSFDRLDWTDWAPLVEGAVDPVMNYGNYFQYRILFETPDGLALPKVSFVEIQFEAIERVEVSLDNATWYIAFGSYEWNITMLLEEGPNTIYLRLFDTKLIPTYRTVNFQVDTIKPTGILKINGGDKYTTKTNVSLSLAAVDVFGVTHMKIGLSDNLTAVDWQEFQNSMEFDLPLEDGTRTVYIKLKDTTGHESNIISDSIVLDTTPPNGTVHIKNKAPMTTFLEVPLSFAATDTNGITNMRVSNTNDFSDVNWMAYAATADWGLTEGDGEKTVYVEFMDSAGLTNVATDTIILDTERPDGTIVINGGEDLTTERLVTITADASDENGVSHIMLSNDANFINTFWASYNDSIQWTLEEVLGETTVYARFKDSAGLVSETASDSIVLDIHVEGFEGSMVINGGDRYANDQRLKLTMDLIGNDGGSMMMISESPGFSGASWQAYSNEVYYETSKEGQVVLYAKFKDQFDITSDVVQANITVDIKPPTVSITSPNNNTKVDKQAIVITGKASDDVELVSVDVQLPNGQWMSVKDPGSFSVDVNLRKEGTYTLKVRATDEAGNTAMDYVTVKYKEKASNSGGIPGFEATVLLISLIGAIAFMSRRRSRA